MTSAYILIVAILVLGGVIATLGDRLGTRVGKARLSLFKLRPRTTATLVTIITGSLISASTLGILFGLSESLREGVFELDNILKTLRRTRSEVQTLNAQKTEMEGELTKVQKRLNGVNRNFKQAQIQLKTISQQATNLQKEIKSLLLERQSLRQERNQLQGEINELEGEVDQLKTLVEQRDQEVEERDLTIKERNQKLAEQETKLQEISKQATHLRTEINSLLTERQGLIEQRNQLLNERQTLIAQRNELKSQITQLETQVSDLKDLVAQRDQELGDLEKQKAFLEQQVDILEEYYQNYQVLRQGNVALLRGQVLAFGVVRIVDPSAASTAVDQLLREANRTAMSIISPSNSQANEPLVQITETQANQLINQIKDGQDYVVRILSAGNYVQGERQIQVFADAALNQIVFKTGDVLAAISTDTSTSSNEQIQQRLDQLVAASQFRARRAGMLGPIQVADGSPGTIIQFIEQLEQYNQPVDIQAVVQDVTYASGPLKIKFIAIQNGQILFGT